VTNGLSTAVGPKTKWRLLATDKCPKRPRPTQGGVAIMSPAAVIFQPGGVGKAHH